MSFDAGDATVIAARIKALAHTSYLVVSTDMQVRVRKYPFLVHVLWRTTDGNVKAEFTLLEQPNCCGVLISTKTSVAKEYQGKNIAQNMMLLKEAIAKEFGYSCLSATVNATGNPAECHILEKFGWKGGHEFINKRTKNVVRFYQKTLE